MPSIDDRLREIVDRLASTVLPGEFERVLARRIRRRFLHLAGVAGLALAVAAGTVGGTYALTRVFRASDMSSSPPASEPPDENPCPGNEAHEVHGDFDGDGREDAALVYPKEAIQAPDCTLELPRMHVISISLASGHTVETEFECDRANCSLGEVALGEPLAPDFDGDGRAELWIEVRGGVSFAEFAVYRVAFDGLTVLDLADPGDPEGGLEPGPIRLRVQGGLYQRASLGCETNEEGARVVVQKLAKRVGDTSTWEYHETVLIFDGEAFSVVSSSDETISEDDLGSYLTVGACT